MKYIIAYDIANNKKRKKVANELEGLGYRVNKSVFECELSKTRLAKLVKFLHKTAGKSDSVRLYRICENCLESSFDISGAELFEARSLFVGNSG
nr:CRISPR-associated endonuclease Cas2 [uncultured Campylobacter sp.]